MKLVNLRWKRWAVGLAVALALYALAGFWLLPRVIQSQVSKQVHSLLARQAVVDEVSFNPFSLRLEAHGLRLSEADGAPLFALQGLVLELQWRSLFVSGWRLAELRLTEPSMQLVLAKDGKFNLAELLASLPKDDKPADKTSKGLPALVIELFALERGKLTMDDRRAGYSNVASPVDLRLTHFSTLPDDEDAYTFSAVTTHGGKLRWKGEFSLQPAIKGQGELVLENLPLHEPAVYLKSFTRATLASGKLTSTLPYRFAYDNGRFEATLNGARLAVQDLAVARQDAAEPFAALKQMELNGINADLLRREATVAQLRVVDGKLQVSRDAHGVLDVATLALPPAAAASAPAVPASAPAAPTPWKLAIQQVLLDQLALSAEDHGASPVLKLSGKLHSQLRVAAEQTADALKLNVDEASAELSDVVVASGAGTPVKLAHLGLEAGSLDLAAHRAAVGRVYAQGGQLELVRDAKGEINVLSMLPKAGQGEAKAAPAPEKPSTAAAATSSWYASIRQVELSQFAAAVQDQASGIQLHLVNLGVTLSDAGTDLAKPVKFNAGFTVREGGQFAAKGSVVPASAVVRADLKLKALALAPVQPLLAQHVHLKLAGGTVSAQGKLATGSGANAKNPALQYQGSLAVDGLVLNEEDGNLFAAWNSVGADGFTLNVKPNLLEVPELRVVQPNAKLIIENDRSLNAARLLVQQPASPASAAASAARPPAQAQPAAATPAVAASAAPAEAFPIRIHRLRLRDAKLDFADLSLRPQFAAKIYELGGVVNGLSSDPKVRSQIELDGRVDEFGLARVRGELNPFAPRDNTNVGVQFKNVDMVPASPYSMKFAGYRIAEGRISLDLQYKVANGRLDGDNKIVIDNLTLGERVDSPDALKLPLELALAILKDSDGRIDLGVPVSGDLNDPQFSYGAVIWKAIGNVLTKIVTSPFRALGALLGISGDKLEAIDFDAGSAKLLPPEREKLQQVAQLLAKRAQLKLTAPASYSEAADAAALKARALRQEVFTQAGIKLAAGEEPGPLDSGDRAVRVALRELYAKRFGAAELDKQKEQAVKAAAGSAADAPGGTASAPATGSSASLPLWQRLGKMVQGEPQVADARAFYAGLQTRLEQTQPLPADALPQLAAQRAQAIVAALKEAGVDPVRMAAGSAPEKVDAAANRMVPVKLGLTAGR
jgi:hypothetical protein